MTERTDGADGDLLDPPFRTSRSIGSPSDWSDRPWLNVTAMQVAAFLAVAEVGSQRRAAAALKVSDYIIKNAIRGLAEVFGWRVDQLITSNNHGQHGKTYVLTELGQRLLPEMRRLRDRLDGFSDLPNQLLGGPIQVRHLPHHTLFVTQAGRKISQDQPDLRFRASVLGEHHRGREAFTNRVLWPLYEGKWDMVIGLGLPEVTTAHHRDLSHPVRGLTDVFLYTARLELRVRVDDVQFKNADGVPLRALAGTTVLTPMKDTRSRSLLDSSIRAAGLPPLSDDSEEEYESKVLVIRASYGTGGWVMLPSDAALQFEHSPGPAGWGPLAGAESSRFRWLPIVKDAGGGLGSRNELRYRIYATYRTNDERRKRLDALAKEFRLSAEKLLKEHGRGQLVQERSDR